MPTVEGVPANWRVPGQYVQVSNELAAAGLSAMPRKVLAIGQSLAAGTATLNVPYLISSATIAKTYFGAGSMLAHICEAVLAANPYAELWAIAEEDDGSAVAASGSIVVSGPATADGTIALYIGGRRVTVSVSDEDAANSIATAIGAAITADTDLPVSASVDTATVTVTAKNGGVAGNYIDIRENYLSDDETPAGVSLAITAMASGATNPTLTDLIAALGEEMYTDIVFPYSDATSLAAIEAEMDRRWGALVQLYCHAFAASDKAYADLVTLGASRNNEHLTIMASTGSPVPPWVWAAQVAAVHSYYAAVHPALPYQTLRLPGLATDYMAPAVSARLTDAQRNTLLNGGIATHKVASDGTVQIERLITTYEENDAGAADDSYLDVNTLDTLAYLAYDWKTYMTSKYARSLLLENTTRIGAGISHVTPAILTAEAVARFEQWEEAGFVQDADQFKDDISSAINSTDVNRLDSMLVPNLAKQFRVGATKIAFL